MDGWMDGPRYGGVDWPSSHLQQQPAPENYLDNRPPTSSCKLDGWKWGLAVMQGGKRCRLTMQRPRADNCAVGQCSPMIAVVEGSGTERLGGWDKRLEAMACRLQCPPSISILQSLSLSLSLHLPLSLSPSPVFSQPVSLLLPTDQLIFQVNYQGDRGQTRANMHLPRPHPPTVASSSWAKSFM